jgi:hypothetical protein
MIIPEKTETVSVELEKIQAVVSGSTNDTVTIEREQSTLVQQTNEVAITNEQVYNVVVEVNNSSTIVVGQPGPQGPVGLSEDSMAYARQTDFVGEDVIYKGEAEAGSLTSSPLWRIRKITIVNDDISETWANGNTDFDKVWDDRYTLNYI